MKWWEVCYYHSNCVSWYFCFHCAWIARWAWYEIDSRWDWHFLTASVKWRLLLSEHHHLYSYRSCHLLNCVSIIWNVAKFVTSCQRKWSCYRSLPWQIIGSLTEAFFRQELVEWHLAAYVSDFSCGNQVSTFLHVKSCPARLTLVGPWLGEEWGRFWLDLRFK